MQDAITEWDDSESGFFILTENVAGVEALAQGFAKVESENDEDKKKGSDSKNETGAVVIVEGQHHERVGEDRLMKVSIHLRERMESGLFKKCLICDSWPFYIAHVPRLTCPHFDGMTILLPSPQPLQITSQSAAQISKTDRCHFPTAFAHQIPAPFVEQLLPY